MYEKDAKKIANALKPPRCPRCGIEINYLSYLELAWNKSTVYLHEDSLEYSSWDTIDVVDYEFHCPECGEFLFKSPEEAKKFLMNESA